MKIYLSGPMHGVPELNFPLFREVTLQLRDAGFDVVSIVELDEADPGESPSWGTYLGRDVEIIANLGIEGLVLLPAWEHSRGARLEASLGLILGLKFFEWKYRPSTDTLCAVRAHPEDIALALFQKNMKSIR